MPIPDFQSIFRPLLAFGKDGSEKNINEAIAVIARILGCLTRGRVPYNARINGVQVLVLKVFIHAAMERVRAAGYDLVELASGRVTEFRAELVLQNSEVSHSIGWDIN